MKNKKKSGNGYAAKYYARSFGGNIAFGIFLIIFAVFMAIPLVYAFVNAFKPFEEIFVFPPRLYVVNPTWDNFVDLFDICSNTWVPFTKYLFNSVFVSVVTTVLTIVISSMCAYPLAKNQFRGKNVIFSLIVTSLLFVAQVTFLPQYLIIAKLGLIDTYSVMILPALGSTLGVFLMKQFMEQIPTALLEAARMDGCNEFYIWYKIVMPNVKPAWITVMIFTFQGVWNNSGSQQFVFKESLRTLPTMMSQIVSGSTIARAGVSSAATVFLMVPPILLFLFSQFSVVQTMAFAGIKE